jgi:hypothetical protein
VAAALEVGDEPRHHVMLENDHVRAISVRFAEGEETLIHTHAVDSLYFFLVPPAPVQECCQPAPALQVLNTIYCTETNTVTVDNTFMEYGECRFGNHCTKNLTHKIKCIKSGNGLGVHCVDIEVKNKCPLVSGDFDEATLAVDNDVVTLVKDKEKAIVYLVTIHPSCSWTFATYPFFYLLLTMTNGDCTTEKGSMSWSKPMQAGQCEWHTAGEAPWSIRNDSALDIAFYIIQWK